MVRIVEGYYIVVERKGKYITESEVLPTKKHALAWAYNRLPNTCTGTLMRSVKKFDTHRDAYLYSQGSRRVDWEEDDKLIGRVRFVRRKAGYFPIFEDEGILWGYEGDTWDVTPKGTLINRR